MYKNLFNIVSYRLIISVTLLVGIGLVLLSLSMTETSNGNSRVFAEKKHNEDSKLSDSVASKNMAGQESFWKAANFLDKEITDNIKSAYKNVIVVSNRKEIMNVDMFYREAKAPVGVIETGQTVLLLHGMAFKSQTWLELNTINILAAMGHRVVAIDLPGYGETNQSFNGNKEDYLNAVITSLSLKNVVIVSPSMSGGYSIPFLVKFSSHVQGYVPVAPVSTELVHGHEKDILTPTLIIYGELDTTLGIKSRNNLSILPNSQVVVLPGAKHPAYLDKPDLFHKYLYNFLSAVHDRAQIL